MKRLFDSIFLIAIMGFNLNAQNSKLQLKSTGFSAPYVPIPEVQAKQPIDNVPMSDLNAFSEIKFDDLPGAPGPFEPTWESIEKNYPGEPAWLREAKFGIWVHFGPQSAGESGDWYALNDDWFCNVGFIVVNPRGITRQTFLDL